MTGVPDKISISEGERLYPHFRDTLVYMAMAVRAIESLKPVKWYGPSKTIALISRTLKKELAVPINGVFEAAIDGHFPKTIQMTLRPVTVDFNKEWTEVGLASVSLRLESALFAISYEEQIAWMRANGHSDIKKWPPIAAFCRYVRNAISHEGRISADKPDTPSAEWNGIKYGPAANGRQIIGRDLGAADLLVLMVQLETEINQLRGLQGAP